MLWAWVWPGQLELWQIVSGHKLSGPVGGFDEAVQYGERWRFGKLWIKPCLSALVLCLGSTSQPNFLNNRDRKLAQSGVANFDPNTLDVSKSPRKGSEVITAAAAVHNSAPTVQNPLLGSLAIHKCCHISGICGISPWSAAVWAGCSHPASSCTGSLCRSGQQSGVNCVPPSLPAAAQKHPNPSGAKFSGIS